MSRSAGINKIIYIVDEKKRDLLPTLSLAKNVQKKKKIDQYIVQFNQIIKLKKDFLRNSIIVVNYFRINIMHHLIYYYILNCKIIINDTEGAGDKDGFFVVRNIVHLKSFIPILSQYWLWGTNQMNKLPSYLKINGLFLVTGFIRLSKKIFIYKRNKKNILINTNFTIINPKYSTGYQEEIKNAKKVSQTIKDDYVKFEAKKEEIFIKNIKKIILKLPKENFIIRNHPFENENKWKKIFSNYKNVIVRKKGDVLEEINQAKLLIQNNCTTAVEAYYNQTNVISFGWLHSKKYDPIFPLAFSSVEKNVENVVSKIKKNSYTKPRVNKKFLGFYKNLKLNKKDPIDLCVQSILSTKPNKKNKKFNFLFFIYLIKFFIVKSLFISAIRVPNLNLKKDKTISIKDIKKTFPKCKVIEKNFLYCLNG